MTPFINNNSILIGFDFIESDKKMAGTNINQEWILIAFFD